MAIILNLLWQIVDANGQIFIGVIGQIIFPSCHTVRDGGTSAVSGEDAFINFQLIKKVSKEMLVHFLQINTKSSSFFAQIDRDGTLLKNGPVSVSFCLLSSFQHDTIQI